MHYNQRRHSIWRVFTVVINPLAEKFLKTCLPVCLRERVRGNNTIWFLKIFIRGLLIEASFIPEMRKAVNAANKFLQFSPTTMCWRTILNVTQIYCLFYDTHKQNWWLTHDPNQLCHDNSSTEVTESQRFPSSLGVLDQAGGSDEGGRGHRDAAPEHLGKKRSCNPPSHHYITTTTTTIASSSLLSSPSSPWSLPDFPKHRRSAPQRCRQSPPATPTPSPSPPSPSPSCWRAP